MRELGRNVRLNEHHPLVRYSYQLFKSFRSHHIRRAFRENFVRAKSWLQKPNSTNVFEKDWDVLVILDAARHDEVERQKPDLTAKYYDSIHSVASCTWQWIPRTFDSPHTPALRDMAYISANPHTASLDHNKFGLLEEVWRVAYDDEIGTIRPRAVTDHAIKICRSKSFDRIIIHYMQPHAPYIGDYWNQNHRYSIEASANVWGAVTDGSVQIRDVIKSYRENLRIVLSEVMLLLENIDADHVVISSDHGEAFGERGIYGHPADMYIDSLINIPWIETSGTDERTHDPKDHKIESDSTVEDQLQSLGYV